MQGVMCIYTKDGNASRANGSQRSPINSSDPAQRPQGLFFMANVDFSGDPIPLALSPFGDTRVIIPINSLITPDMNMYFADFYCAGGRRGTHYVTLVLARTGSHMDQVYTANLVTLSRHNNPFLRQSIVRSNPTTTVQTQGSQVHQIPRPSIDTYWEVNSKIWVEVLYPENVLLQYGTLQYGKEKKTTRRPQEKTKGCTICNI